MLKDEYPQIKDIVVHSSDLMGDLGTSYRVGIGIEYDDLVSLTKEGEDSLKDTIKNLSKYVLGKKDWFESSFFYDPYQY